MEKFIKIYYSLLHSDLTRKAQRIYSFLITAFESNEPLSYSISELSKELEYDKKNKFSLVREKYNEIINT